MTVAFNDIWKATAVALVGPHLIDSVATGGTGDSLIDTLQIDSYATDQLYKGGFLRFKNRVSPNHQRRIVHHEPENGRFIFDPLAGGATVAAGEPYFALRPYRPEWITACINNALDKMQVVDTVEVASIADATHYDLSVSAPWLVSREQLLGLDLRSGVVANSYGWTEIAGLEYGWDQAGRELVLLGGGYGAGETLRIRALRAGGSGVDTAFGGSVAALPNVKAIVQWAAAEAVLELLSKPYAARIAAQSQRDWQDTIAAVAKEVESYRARYLPRESWSIWRSDGDPWDITGNVQP